MSASSSILRGKRKIRRCKRKPAGVNDISRFLLWSGKTKSPAYFHTLSIFGGRGWITQAAHLKRPRRGFFAAGTYSGGPYELRLPIFLQPLGGALKNRSAVPASPPCFRRRRRSAPQLFESTLGYALKSFGQKRNSSIFMTLEFLVGAGGFEQLAFTHTYTGELKNIGDKPLFTLHRIH